MFDTVTKILKNLKREGTIQLYIFSGDFQKKSTEVAYLENKYPDIDKIDSEKTFFLIKV
jgi:hypothetical protein